MRLIEKQGHLGIDKKEIDALIAKKNFIGLNHSPRSEKVIVSLTSYKPRINDVKYALYSLLNQTFPPDKLILWLDEDSFPQREKNLPNDLLKFKSFGLTIDWCENLRPYKKLIPALEKYPDDIIVTADDDIFYRPDWLEILYAEHIKNPDCVIAHRAHRLRLDEQGNLLPYTSWHFAINSTPSPDNYQATEIYSRVRAASFTQRNFFTSGAGVTFKKKNLHADILKRELFTKLAPLADDIWFWAMAVLNSTKIKIPAAAQRKLIYVDIDTQISGETLYSVNKTQNDVQLQQVIEYYPALLETLIREDADSKPYISVVLPVKNPDNLSACIENIFWQHFPDFELIFINLGARINFSPLPTNFHVINYPGGSLVDALNLGLRKAEGEYILFADENSTFPRDALDVVAQIANSSAAEVIHFSAHAEVGKIILDDALKFDTETPIFFEEPGQRRALFWFKNKLSRRLDTKIFKREFLTKHGINFNNGTEEFLFATLTQSEKYLLVPQAFCSIRK